jgi:N-sulfoglucosamine sulfohydrolase
VDRGLTHYGKRSVEAFLHRPEWELYDLDQDPDEVNNLAGNPEYRESFNRLSEQLKLFGKQTRDPWTADIGL